MGWEADDGAALPYVEAGEVELLRQASVAPSQGVHHGAPAAPTDGLVKEDTGGLGPGCVGQSVWRLFGTLAPHARPAPRRVSRRPLAVAPASILAPLAPPLECIVLVTSTSTCHGRTTTPSPRTGSRLS
ncbi:hypothetical protein ZWY2020_032825 [Hordeum vulgare]|nr:hypothetical protein ZWY2020_032825 [Hordeum vulgare]